MCGNHYIVSNRSFPNFSGYHGLKFVLATGCTQMGNMIFPNEMEINPPGADTRIFWSNSFNAIADCC